MKLLMESWRKFMKEVSYIPGGASMPAGRPSSRCPQGQKEIGPPSEDGKPRCVKGEPLTERMEFGDGFERWIHGEPEVEPIRGPESMDVDDDEFGQAPHCKPRSIDPECLEEYGFEKIGEGSFRAVYALPDNPNYVMKIADELWDDADTKDMNKQEAEIIGETYSDLLPKVYDVADDYSWIVVERVKPYGISSDKWIYDFFPIFAKFWKDNQNNVEFEWRNTSLEDFFGEYTESRRDEIREPNNSNLTYELGGEKTREELESQLPPLYKRFLEFIEQYGVEPIEIRGDNVGIASDGRFVILDSGWDLDALGDILNR
jgi:hypothetical protein